MINKSRNKKKVGLTVLISTSVTLNLLAIGVLNNAHKELNQKQSTVDNLALEVIDLEKEISQSKEENSILLKDNKTQIDIITNLEETVKEKDSSLNSMKMELQEKDAEIKKLKKNKEAEVAKETNTTEKSTEQSNKVELSNTKTLTVEASGYGATDGSQSGITATGIDVRGTSTYNGMGIIAVDPSVIPLWTVVEIEGYGKFIALDTGGMIKGLKIDILFPTQEDAFNFGRKDVVVKF